MRGLTEILLTIGMAGSALAAPVVNSPTGLASPSFFFDFTNPAPTLGPNGTGAVAGNNSGFNPSTYSNLGLTMSAGTVTMQPDSAGSTSESMPTMLRETAVQAPNPLVSNFPARFVRWFWPFKKTIGDPRRTL